MFEDLFELYEFPLVAIICWIFVIISFFIIKFPLTDKEKKVLSKVGICCSIFGFLCIAYYAFYEIPDIYDSIDEIRANMKWYYYSSTQRTIEQEETKAFFLVVRTIISLAIHGLSIYNYWMIIFRQKYFSFKRIKCFKSPWATHDEINMITDITLKQDNSFSEAESFKEDI